MFFLNLTAGEFFALLGALGSSLRCYTCWTARNAEDGVDTAILDARHLRRSNSKADAVCASHGRSCCSFSVCCCCCLPSDSCSGATARDAGEITSCYSILQPGQENAAAKERSSI